MPLLPIKAERFIIVVLCCLTYALVYYHRVCPAILSDELAEAMNVSESEMGSFGSMYFWPYALTQPIAGLLADIIEPAYIMTFSMTLTSIGSIVIATSNNFALCCFARALIGLGCGPNMVPICKILASWFSPKGFYFYQGAVLMSGAAGGIIAQGPLASAIVHIPWRMTFYFIGGVGILIAILLVLLVRGSPRAAGYSDSETLGILPSLPSENVSTSMSTPLLSDSTTPARSGVWATIQRHFSTLKRNSTTVLSNRNFWTLVLWNCFIPGNYYNFTSLWGGPYLTNVFKMTDTKAGYILVLLSLAYIVGTPILSVISEHFKTRKWVVVSTSLVSLAVAFGFVFLKPEGGQVWLLVLIFSFGFVGCAPTSTAVTMFKEMQPPDMAGTAMGCSNFFPFAATSILQLLVSFLLKKFDPSTDPMKPSWTGFQRALWIPNCIFSFIGLLGALFTGDTYPFDADRIEMKP